MQIVMSQSESSKPDYAALVKAVSLSTPTPEDWLAVGQPIYSPTYGFGQVIGVLGSRLVVDFEKLASHVSFSNWQNAVESGSVVKAEDAPVQTTSPVFDLVVYQSNFPGSDSRV
jgi:DEAD/DEAH box helicase domain-containing protein